MDSRNFSQLYLITTGSYHDRKFFQELALARSISFPFWYAGLGVFFYPSSKSIEILLFSLGLSFIVTLVALVITIPAAKALALYQFRGKKFIEILTFAPIIVPTVAVAMGIHVQFIRWDWQIRLQEWY